MKIIEKTFGEKLKAIRTARNMSQEEFARLLNTSKQVISRYELGQNVPKITVVGPWCRILNVSLDDMLLEETQQDTPTAREWELLHAYRQHPEAQPFVDKLLDIPREEVPQLITKARSGNVPPEVIDELINKADTLPNFVD